MHSYVKATLLLSLAFCIGFIVGVFVWYFIVHAYPDLKCDRFRYLFWILGFSGGVAVWTIYVVGNFIHFV
jgi:hypothetical protein